MTTSNETTKPVALFKGEFSHVYGYKMHLIQITDPTGWKPSWTVTDRLTGKRVLSSVSLKACMADLDRRLEREVA